MNKQPKISIIIIVYNTELYLSECLDSVINQTLKDIEIIVVNDCSLGNCIEIVELYKKNDNRIKLINLQKNCGSLVARNIGVLDACGEYVQFVDSDDWLELDCCEKIYTALINTDSDMCYLGVRHYTQNNKSIPFINIKDQVLSNNELIIKFINFRFKEENTFIEDTLGYGAVQYIARRHIAQEVGQILIAYDNINMMEDFAQVALYVLRSQQCVCLSFYGYNYRIGVGITSNITQQSVEKYSSNIQQVFKVLKIIAEQYHTFSSLEEYNKIKMYNRLSFHFYNWVGTYSRFSYLEQQAIRNILCNNDLSYVLLFLYPPSYGTTKKKFDIGIINSIKHILKGGIFLVASIVARIKKEFKKLRS